MGWMLCWGTCWCMVRVTSGSGGGCESPLPGGVFFVSFMSSLVNHPRSIWDPITARQQLCARCRVSLLPSYLVCLFVPLQAGLVPPFDTFQNKKNWHFFKLDPSISPSCFADSLILQLFCLQILWLCFFAPKKDEFLVSIDALMLTSVAWWNHPFVVSLFIHSFAPWMCFLLWCSAPLSDGIIHLLLLPSSFVRLLRGFPDTLML